MGESPKIKLVGPHSVIVVMEGKEGKEGCTENEVGTLPSSFSEGSTFIQFFVLFPWKKKGGSLSCLLNIFFQGVLAGWLLLLLLFLLSP